MALPTMDGGIGCDVSPSGFRTRVAALLEVLDDDVRHVEASLLRLDTLRKLLIKRDDGALQKLLQEIHEQGEPYAVTEHRRQELRHALAADLGCSRNDLTLSDLAAHLDGQDRSAVAQRQTRLKILIAQLKREHVLTSLLIADCARFNRSLLRVFFGPTGQTSTTYSPSGAARHVMGMTLLNMQL